MKHKLNTKELLNLLLVKLVGKSLVKQWWCSPNRAFGSKTPIAMWKGTTFDQTLVKRYLIQAVMQEGS